ncbi:tetratricopeptide repeat protein [Streptomyces albus]|uniref:tetratricopeptide repeat protein n=1 Tax=Streptomyces albus TaxID=1888 RepID=UPI003F50E264
MGNATGPHSQVTNITERHIHLTPPRREEVVWPVEVGPVPQLATAFQPRAVVREGVDAARASGEGVVLTQVFSGGGGVGKSQLAAAYAGQALAEGAELVVWATAGDEAQIVAQYAQAAARVGVPGADGNDLQEDARAFCAWLATTSRRWLVVLDDVTDPVVVEPWWPVSRTGTGWVLATTRLRDARLTGGGRRRIDIGVYTPEEAAAYLHTRLAREDMEHLVDEQAGQLAEALGYLPLALGHAAAHMINEDLSCTAYLDLFQEEETRLEEILPATADAEGYGRQITATLLLALDAAQHADGNGLVVPVLRLAALLDPAGHPHTLWATEPVLTYLTGHRTETPTGQLQEDPAPRPAVTAGQARAALRLLHRYALLTCDTRAEPRAVRIHALTARAVRETTPAGHHAELAVTAADGLLEVWPDPDQPHPDLAATLRTNAETLSAHARQHLWHPEGHSLLFHAGNSLINAGLSAAATDYWQQMVTDSTHFLGPEHPDTLTTRHNLALSYRDAGRTQDAINLHEQVLTDSERLLGPEHPDTLQTRNNLATSYWQAGRTQDAINLLQQVLADRERILGPHHPDTLRTRGNLATSYADAGRTQDAINLQEQVITDRERILGPHHPDTLTARGNLAASYWQAGRTQDAINLHEQVLAERERTLGPHHPDTLQTRHNLATSYWQAGRTQDAINLHEQVLAERERTLGPEHPDTLQTRHNLATSYADAGRTQDAINLLQQVLADSECTLGPDHPDTLTARHNLATSYRDAGRTQDAINLHEQVLAERECTLGPHHPDTLQTRHNLATSYADAGRTQDAINLHEQVLADRERILGHNQPDTLQTRGNLASSYRDAGRTQDAINLHEQVLAERERILGPEHPDTLTARHNLATSYRDAGRTQDAINLHEQVLADRERTLGPHHPDTLQTRHSLAVSYWQAGRTQDAINLEEQVLADRERVLGPDHPDTVRVRETLSGWKRGGSVSGQ